MFKWFKKDKRESSKESPVPKSAGLPSLPFHSAFATTVKTGAYTNVHTKETQWLLAKCKNGIWEITSCTRKPKADGSFVISAKIDEKNKGITYAHVLCRLAEYEHIRKNDAILLPDDTIDQRTTAKHFVVVANHDGVAIDTDGKPQMSENGEFFSGEFSEEQRDAVYQYHSNPMLEKIDNKSQSQEDFLNAAETAIFEDIASLKEVEVLIDVTNFLKGAYKQKLNAMIEGNSSRTAIVGVGNPELVDEDGTRFLQVTTSIKDRFQTVENIPVIDKERVSQLMNRIPILFMMGNLRLLKLDKIPFYSRQSTDPNTGGTTSTHMAESSKKEVKTQMETNLLYQIRIKIEEADKTKDRVKAREIANNYSEIAKNERGKEVFLAEVKKVDILIEVLEREIKKLNEAAITQTHTERLIINDPQTGKLRAFTP